MEGNGLVAGLDQARTYAGAIDCDLHPAVPGMGVLLPYLDDYWREMVSVRALDRLNLSLTSYPQIAAVLSSRLASPGRREGGLLARSDARPCARSVSTTLWNSKLPLRRAGPSQ